MSVETESVHPLSICQPLGDRVVVKRDVPPKQAGNIILPDRNHKMNTGTVHSVGPGKLVLVNIPMPADPLIEFGKPLENYPLFHIPMRVKVGDRVILTSYAGLDISDPDVPRDDEDEYIILREEDLLAVIPPKKATVDPVPAGPPYHGDRVGEFSRGSL